MAILPSLGSLISLAVLHIVGETEHASGKKKYSVGKHLCMDNIIK
jgi:hypothetical protein